MDGKPLFEYGSLELDRGIQAVNVLLSMPVFSKEYELMTSLHQAAAILYEHRDRCEKAKQAGAVDPMKLGFRRLEE